MKANAQDLSTRSRRTYRMDKRAEASDATRARVLDAVRAMVREGAFHEASLEEVAARAGVSRMTVYRRFGSKRELLQAMTWDELGRVRLDRLDAAHANPDVRGAVRDVLRENCRMFAAMGDGLAMSLELARHNEDMAAIVDATYHGRRHAAMERLAKRIASAGLRAPGWTNKQVVDALLVLTSYETFETLTARRGRSVESAAATLFAMAGSFLVDPA